MFYCPKGPALAAGKNRSCVVAAAVPGWGGAGEGLFDFLGSFLGRWVWIYLWPYLPPLCYMGSSKLRGSQIIIIFFLTVPCFSSSLCPDEAPQEPSLSPHYWRGGRERKNLKLTAPAVSSVVGRGWEAAAEQNDDCHGEYGYQLLQVAGDEGGGGADAITSELWAALPFAGTFCPRATMCEPGIALHFTERPRKYLFSGVYIYSQREALF